MARRHAGDIAYRTVRTLTVAAGAHPRGVGFLSAASGLVRIGDRCHVVADDEHHLASFTAGASVPRRLSLVRLLDGDLPGDAGARKAAKPDFESLVRLPPTTGRRGGALLALGSGSRPNRRSGVLLSLRRDGRTTGEPTVVDLAPLYRLLRARFDDINIEGAFILGEALCLLQRDKSGKANVCIRLALDPVLALLDGKRRARLTIVAETRFDLGAVDGVPLAFTDGAALPDGRWVFSAVAERNDDSYLDGECVGAAIGVVDAEGRLASLQRLVPTRKVEGIEARLAGSRIVVGLVTDADDPEVPAEYGTVTL